MKKKYLSGLFVLLLIAFMLAACGSSGGGGDGDGNGSITPTTTVSGTVLDINNNPVEGAEVTITSDPVTVTTDANGIFSATVEIGAHTIEIKMGSQLIHSGQISCEENTPLALGNITTDYDPIIPTTTVSGTVLDINNNPVEGAEVTITSDPVKVTTNANGIFSAIVEVGPHTIEIKMGSQLIHSGQINCKENTPLALGNITTDYEPRVTYGLTLPLYDDFSSSDIDRTKWYQDKFVREIQDGSIIFEHKNFDSNQNNYLWIANPETVSSISAEVTVTEYAASGARLEVRLRGVFYNDGSSGASSGSSIGDIFAEVRLRDGEVINNVFRCIDDGCIDVDVLDSGAIGAYNLGETHKIGIEWDETNTRFIFSFDGSLNEVDTSTLNAPVISSTPNRPFMGIGSRIRASWGEYGSITSAFDNVHVNGTLYDDFSQSSIDFSKWTNGERIRKIESGKLILTTREEGKGSEELNFHPAIFAMYADVTVTDYEDTGGYTRARLQGSYYNATTGSTSITGDIWADIRIDDNTAYYAVYKVLDDEWTSEEYVSGTSDDPRVSLGTVSMNETHGLFIQWDGSKFTFQLDDDPVKTFDPVAAGYPVVNAIPNVPVKNINVRTSSSSGQPSKITASFDNVRVGSSIGSTVVGTWDLTRDDEGNAVPSGTVTLIMTDTTYSVSTTSCEMTGTYTINGTSMTLTEETITGNDCNETCCDINIFQFTVNSTTLAFTDDDGTMIFKRI